MKRFLLLVVIPFALVALALWLWLQGGRFEETENAYVKAHIVAVSADVSGRVVEVGVKDNQAVEKGALLFRVDPAPFELAVARAEAQMALARTEVERLRGEYRVARAELAEAESRIGFLERQLERQAKLREKGMGLEASHDEARHNLDAARRRIDAARENAARVLAALGGDAARPAEKHPSYLAAQAARDAGRDELARVRVVAPSAGIVSNMRLQAGERVEKGVAVFSLIEAGPVWIEANFKETQLTHMREGQPVTLVADAYPEATFRGKVGTIAPATKAEFSLLPAQNSSGNWVKVVQRVPVLIALEPELGQPQLRAGMTVTARVDTGHERSFSSMLSSSTSQR
jgi:membrane fusion protein (multidrug efflux system)